MGPKTGIPGPFRAQNRYILKSSHNRTLSYEPCYWSKAHCTCFWPDKAQVHRVCLLCLTLNCFLSFLSQSEALHSSTLCTPYESRRTGRPPPPSIRRHTSDTRICLYTSAEIHRDDIGIPTCTMATDVSASAACEIEVGLIYPTMQTR